MQSELSIIEQRRADIIARMRETGTLAPAGVDCRSCAAALEFENPSSHMMPSHTASPRCESGGHPHCTCDVCF